ncbi:hypothetical protein OF83DRAFT_1112141 [Amylostereum chailletii]|nr:hypothetical protein OF83DRAFT_1112141 [Amylostereum chailletii]
MSRPCASEFWLSVADKRALLDQSPLSEASISHAEVEEEISALENMIILVKRNRNHKYLPVSRLPSELLASIFAFVRADSTHESTQKDSWAPVYVGYAILIHTCHRWRKIALATPALWVDISIPQMPQKWGEMLLERSASMPIFVDARTEADHVRLPGFLTTTILANHRSRIRKLRIFQPGGSWGDRPNPTDVVSVLTQSMPLLESVDLRLSTGSSRFPPEILSNAPKLTRLSTVDCYISWEASLFSQLVELELIFAARVQPSVVVADMNTLFRRMTRLEVLLIQDFFPVNLPAVHGVPTTNSVIHFPVSLLRLHVRAFICSVEGPKFLESIMPPEHTQLVIEIAVYSGWDIRAIKRRFMQYGGSKCLSVFLEPVGDLLHQSMATSIGVRQTPSNELCDMMSEEQGDLTIRWRRGVHSTGAATVERELSPNLPDLVKYGVSTQDVLELSLSSAYQHSINSYVVFLQQVTHVPWLRITERTAVDLFHALTSVVGPFLSDSPEEHRARLPPHFIFSRLWIFEDSTRRAAHSKQAEAGMAWTLTLNHGPIVEYLRMLNGHKMMLEELGIPRKYKGEPWVEEMRGLVLALIIT